MYKLEQNKWLRVRDVADYLKLSPEMVYKLVQNEDMPSVRIGSSWRINQNELEQWLRVRKIDSRKMHLSGLYKRGMQQFKKQLTKEYGKRLKGIYVFGSFAREEADEESDLDAVVVLKSVSDRWKERHKIISVAYEATYGRDSSFVLSAFLMTEDELMYQSGPLIERIREEGRRV